MSDAPPTVDNATTFLTSSPDIGWPVPDMDCRYTLLSDAELARRLETDARPESFTLGGKTTDGGQGITVVSVAWQPSPTEEQPMEDRKVALDFDWRAGNGTLLCIFDGHVGPHLVEHTAQALPPLIIAALQALPPTASKSTVSSILKSTIEDYDASLLQAVYDIFPLPELERLTEVEIEARMEEDGNEKKALLATRGTTALICLLDPDRKGLWVANVGDCQALLATRDSVNDPWTSAMSPARHLSSTHAGTDPAEIALLQANHPNEIDTVVENGRVLGMIAVSRALGDAYFKAPPIYVDKVFQHFAKSRIASKVVALLPKYLTPPYLSSTPSIVYTPLPDRSPSGPTICLFLCSDGLKDLYDNRPFGCKTLEDEWIRLAGLAIDDPDQGKNAAREVLRDAVGGDDRHRHSANVTVELPGGGKAVDDTTVVVAYW